MMRATTPELRPTTEPTNVVLRQKSKDQFTLALLLPDGVGFRNFGFGNFLVEATKLGHVHLFHLMAESSLPSKTLEENDSLSWQRLAPFTEYPLAFFLRQTLMTAQRYWIGTPPNLSALNRPAYGSLRRKAVMKAARRIGHLCASPERMNWIEQAHTMVMGRSREVAHFRRVFERIRPNVVFSSNQNPLFVIAPVLAANQLGIPTATFVFSWDNLSTKGRIAAPFDHFLVWSDHMKQELHRFYPKISEQHAHVIGTPQFDFYADRKLLWSRSEFCRRIGADPNRSLICYSGGDVEVSKADHLHVAVLMELIRSGQVQGRPQVLLRPGPSDQGTRYDSVRRDFPELIYAPPAWTRNHSPYGDFFGMVPSMADVQFLANLTFHSDLNVNFASTMTLDFAIRDKPVVNVVFEVADPPLFDTSMWEFVRGFEHYDPVVELGAARFAHTRGQFADHVNAYLKNPSLDREGRRRFVELEVGKPIGKSGQCIIEVLRAIAREC